MGYTVTFDRSLEKCIRYRDIDRDSRETENRLKVPISKLFDTKNLFTDNNLDRDSQFLSQIKTGHSVIFVDRKTYSIFAISIVHENS